MAVNPLEKRFAETGAEATRLMDALDGSTFTEGLKATFKKGEGFQVQGKVTLTERGSGSAVVMNLDHLVPVESFKVVPQLYFVYKQGVYGHGVHFISSVELEAIAMAGKLAAADKDDYHTWEVWQYEPTDLSMAGGSEMSSTLLHSFSKESTNDS